MAAATSANEFAGADGNDFYAGLSQQRVGVSVAVIPNRPTLIDHRLSPIPATYKVDWRVR